MERIAVSRETADRSIRLMHEVTGVNVPQRRRTTSLLCRVRSNFSIVREKISAAERLSLFAYSGSLA